MVIIEVLLLFRFLLLPPWVSASVCVCVPFIVVIVAGGAFRTTPFFSFSHSSSWLPWDICYIYISKVSRKGFSFLIYVKWWVWLFEKKEEEEEEEKCIFVAIDKQTKDQMNELWIYFLAALAAIFRFVVSFWVSFGCPLSSLSKWPHYTNASEQRESVWFC